MFSGHRADRPTPIDDSPEPQARVLAQIAEPVATSSVVLTSGRRIEADVGPDGDLVRVRASSGQVVLTVLVTERGPLLRFDAADLAIQAAGRLELACDTFELRAKESITIDAGGVLTETVRGDTHRTAGGSARHEARNIDLVAEPGAIGIRANDDVDLRGERVRLNCEPAPMARSWEEFVAALGGEPP